MLVVLCHPDDASALWLGRELETIGTETAVVSVEQLVYSRSITHILTASSEHGTIRLADGRVLRPEAVSGLINRVRYVPTQHFTNAAPADREYATAELHAFLLAWLTSIAGRVLNPARPLALGGGNTDLTAVRHYAATAGLPTRPWRDSTRDADISSTEAWPDPFARSRAPITHVVSVLDGRVIGPILPAAVQAGCRRLAAYLGTPLLQVAFSRIAGDGFEFAHATPMVDFQFGGRPLAAAIARAVAA
jgi:hypothetical protein